MNADSLRQAGPEQHDLRQRLLELRTPLLTLHKVLIDSERVTFEKTMGHIHSPNHFLQLLTSDPWFTWLQPLSSLIVSIDEMLDQKEPLTIGELDALISQSGRLLVPAEHGDGFPGITSRRCNATPMWCSRTRRRSDSSAPGNRQKSDSGHRATLLGTFLPMSHAHDSRSRLLHDKNVFVRKGVTTACTTRPLTLALALR